MIIDHGENFNNYFLKGNNFLVKKIEVNPNSRLSLSLSLQSHKYRAEHWVVVQGKAK